jgi:3-hydroxyacyl-CoA dehydrogenase
LDVLLSVMEALHRELDEDNYRPCPNLREMVDAGYLGSKTGRGLFQYSRPRHADRAVKPVSVPKQRIGVPLGVPITGPLHRCSVSHRRVPMLVGGSTNL